MGARHRSKVTFVAPTGTKNGLPFSAGSVTVICNDVVGNYGGVNTFSVTTYKQSGGRFQVPSAGTDFIRVLKNHTCGSPTCDGAKLPDPWTQVNRVLSQTGPLTPNLYLPLAIFELRDLPRMLRHAGDLLHNIARPSGLNPVKEAAAANLAYKFGWEPLISDIIKLTRFAEIVRKRQRYLKGAHSSRGIRRRVRLQEINGGGGSYTSIIGSGLYSTVSMVRNHKQWATVRWKVKDQSQIGRTPTFTEAFKTAYGLNRGHIPIAIWKAMPWTWAIDWFTDISNVMQANYNMIYYKPYGLCVMTHYKMTYQFTSDSTATASFDGGSCQIENKGRWVSLNPSPSVTLKLPFLDSFKLSILGSLTILKLSR